MNPFDNFDFEDEFEKLLRKNEEDEDLLSFDEEDMKERKREMVDEAINESIEFVAKVYKTAIEKGLPTDLAEEFARATFNNMIY